MNKCVVYKVILMGLGICSVMAMDPLLKDLLTPIQQLGERCGYESCPTVREGWINVHIAPHSHAELGYTNTFDEHYTGDDNFFQQSKINMKQVLDATISELWADKRRTFTLSDSELPYFFHWWSRRHDTVRRMVYELIRQGRLMFVGGGWGMADEACSYYQSVIDSFTYSLRKIDSTFLTCGRPLVAWQADTFGHSREFASLIAQMGYDGLFINPISFDDEIIRMERKGLEFLWRGSDDLGTETDIYTNKLFDGYWSPPGFCFGSMCSDPLLITSDSLFSNIDERVDVFIDSIIHRQAPSYNTNQVLVVMGQRMGYFNAKIWFENIDKLINHVNKKTYKDGRKMHVMYSSPACYLKAVHGENPVLETKQDDFFPLAYDKHSYTSGFFTSRPTFKLLVREANIFLQTARQLQVLANLGSSDDLLEEFSWIMVVSFSISNDRAQHEIFHLTSRTAQLCKYPNFTEDYRLITLLQVWCCVTVRQLKLLWRIGGIAQDHNVLSGAMRPYVKEYYTKKLYLAVQGASVLITEAINKFRGSPKTTQYRLCFFNISSCPNTEVEKFYIIIYNSLAWPVTMPVRLPILNKKYDVFDPHGNKINAVITKLSEHVRKIPKRRTKVENELVFIAENIPALGYKSYFVEELKVNRRKKSLIKKINKNNQKKYFIRQVSKDNLTYFNDNDNYEDYDYSKTDNKVIFGDNSDVKVTEDYIITPVPTRSAKTTKNYDTTTLSENVQEVTNANDFVDDKTGDSDLIKYDLDEDSYYSIESNDNFIKNKYIQVNIDEYRKISSLNLSNGINVSLDIQFFYYVSDVPSKLNLLNITKRNPGAYIFRSIDSHPEPIMENYDINVFKNDVVNEIHCKYSEYASIALKLYRDSPVVEIDWLVGPVPISDGLGKEVFIRYTTNLDNKGVFYTDSNGRPMIKRIKDSRALYEPYNLDHIAGNYYPVTSRIYIEDIQKNIRFTVFNDRSQGGTSILDGSIDLMLHRRILTDDSGVQTFLNETENDVGIFVRGTHYLYLTKSNYKKNRLFEKKFSKEIELKPQIITSKINRKTDKNNWIRFKNEFTNLKTKLPFGVHILTLQKWRENQLLIRLENFLEKVDIINDGIKKVYLSDLLENIKLKNVTETVLSANMNLKDWTPLLWQTNNSFVKNFNNFYGDDRFGDDRAELSNDTFDAVRDVETNEAILLVTQQIRTFIVDYEYENN